MKKQAIHLWKVLPLAVFMGLAGAAQAQAPQYGVLSAGGQSTNAYSCTIGELVAGYNTGLWSIADKITSGVKGLFSQGDVQIANLGDGSLNITVPEEMVAGGAYYAIYAINGTLLDKGELNAATVNVNYKSALKNSVVILTVESNKAGRVATFKISK